MAEHRLARGRDLIAALEALGTALGYHVELEHPVESDRRSAPAVDVAWFDEEGQVYPLMIFEVESAATNAMANNATKVFGQKTTDFEKPLFYFQIVGQAGDTRRLKNLENLFGNYNYRNFNLSTSTMTDVMEAVLAQHRRIRRSVDVALLRGCLDLAGWDGTSPSDVVRILAKLDFASNYEPTMSLNARRSRGDLDAYVSWLVDHGALDEAYQGEVFREGYEVSRYDTFLGRDTAFPLYLGVVAAVRPHLAPHMEDKFRSWREPSDRVARPLDPYLGYNQELDALLIGGVPVLCAVVGSLMPNVTPELFGILSSLLSCLDGYDGLPNSVWTLHLAAFMANDEAFERARCWMNERGGVNRAEMLLPHGLFGTTGDEDWPGEMTHNLEPVPPMGQFRDMVRAAIPEGTSSSPVNAALGLLGDQSYGGNPPLELIAGLAGPCSVR